MCLVLEQKLKNSEAAFTSELCNCIGAGTMPPNAKCRRKGNDGVAIACSPWYKGDRHAPLKGPQSRASDSEGEPETSSHAQTLSLLRGVSDSSLGSAIATPDSKCGIVFYEGPGLTNVDGQEVVFCVMNQTVPEHLFSMACDLRNNAVGMLGLSWKDCPEFTAPTWQQLSVHCEELSEMGRQLMAQLHARHLDSMTLDIAGTYAQGVADSQGPTRVFGFASRRKKQGRAASMGHAHLFRRAVLNCGALVVTTWDMEDSWQEIQDNACVIKVELWGMSPPVPVQVMPQAQTVPLSGDKSLPLGQRFPFAFRKSMVSPIPHRQLPKVFPKDAVKPEPKGALPAKARPPHPSWDDPVDDAAKPEPKGEPAVNPEGDPPRPRVRRSSRVSEPKGVGLPTAQRSGEEKDTAGEEKGKKEKGKKRSAAHVLKQKEEKCKKRSAAHVLKQAEEKDTAGEEKGKKHHRQSTTSKHPPHAPPHHLLSKDETVGDEKGKKASAPETVTCMEEGKKAFVDLFTGMGLIPPPPPASHPPQPPQPPAQQGSSSDQAWHGDTWTSGAQWNDEATGDTWTSGDTWQPETHGQAENALQSWNDAKHNTSCYKAIQEKRKNYWSSGPW